MVSSIIEVKNCHMVYEDGFAYFPDSISERACKHVQELAELVEQGHLCTVLFVVQREDVQFGVRPSDFHHPEFAQACRAAGLKGVHFCGLKVNCSTGGFEVEKLLDVDLQEYDTAEIARQWESNRPTTGWIRTFGVNGGTLVANAPFPHNLVKADRQLRRRSSGVTVRKTRKLLRFPKKLEKHRGDTHTSVSREISSTSNHRLAKGRRSIRKLVTKGKGKDIAKKKKRSAVFPQNLQMPHQAVESIVDTEDAVKQLTRDRWKRTFTRCSPPIIDLE
eukprot:gnl/MRDRNA2_/MRDRNA2_80669_c0_seq2.p1 gnl/MRDRNA2_/MRDRNA2_80669_c0~~gnl/MRDRNA2_/MRDRNA2_80669_c0_seq2.p1  ORF type:complete len:276 (+),score=41.80 gnl/MRDRNA2_/MRDRNA2_80669_c0_seq2:559-1386(+)